MSPRPTKAPLIPTGLKLVLLFIAVPLLEIFTIITLYKMTGLAFTVGVIIFSALFGVSLMKHQWRQVFGRAARGGTAPGEVLGEAVLLLLAGALLISPGIFTDIVGFSLLVPPLRRAVLRHLMRRFGQGAFTSFAGGGGARGFQFHFATGAGARPPGPAPDDAEREHLEGTPGTEPHRRPFDEQSPFDRIKRD